MERDFYTVPEACEILKISEYYVSKLIRAKAFPCHRVGAIRVISKKDFERWLESREDSV